MDAYRYLDVLSDLVTFCWCCSSWRVFFSLIIFGGKSSFFPPKLWFSSKNSISCFPQSFADCARSALLRGGGRWQQRHQSWEEAGPRDSHGETRASHGLGREARGAAWSWQFGPTRAQPPAPSLSQGPQRGCASPGTLAHLSATRWGDRRRAELPPPGPCSSGLRACTPLAATIGTVSR